MCKHQLAHCIKLRTVMATVQVGSIRAILVASAGCAAQLRNDTLSNKYQIRIRRPHAVRQTLLAAVD
jgi:hypothetical protein